MNDVVRNYTWGGSLRRRRRSLRRRGRGIAKFVLPILALFVLWALWLTRDVYDMAGFIPEDRQIEIYVNNIVERRADIAGSRVWELVPTQTAARRMVDTVTRQAPVPEWILNNLNTGVFHVSGPGLSAPDNLVALTRMTRIGCLAERLVRYTAPIRKDHAGGLKMRHIPEAGLYYAVRGRILLLSFSRDSLVRALTLSPELTLGEAQFQEGVRMAAGADVYCRVDADAWTLPERPFDQLAFALRIEPDAARLVVHGTVSDEFRRRHANILDALGPRKLPAPLDGIAVISADFGMPLPELAREVAAAAGLDATWAQWSSLLETDADPAAPINDMQTLVLQAMQHTGSTMRLAWFGMDAFEMVPAPQIAATFNARAETMLALFERIAPAPPGNVAYDLAPRLEEELFLAYAPFIGGPSLEPTIAAYGQGMIIASSIALARELQESSMLGMDYQMEGNLYAAITPLPAFDAGMNALQELAASGLLRAHTEQTIREARASWRDTAAAVSEIALLAAYDQGDLRAELKLCLAAEQPSLAAEVIAE